MSFLIQPILIDAELRCCDLATKRTAAILGGDAAPKAEANTWRLFEAYPDPGLDPNPEYRSDRAYDGTVKFGVCCAGQVTIALSGKAEGSWFWGSGVDFVSVKHNGEEVFYWDASDPDQPDPPGGTTQLVNPDDVVIHLDERPCGHIIEIRGATGDVLYNNGVYWDATVTVV